MMLSDKFWLDRIWAIKYSMIDDVAELVIGELSSNAIAPAATNRRMLQDERVNWTSAKWLVWIEGV